MARIQLKTIVPHIVLWCTGALLIGGLFALVSLEEKKTRDSVRMQEVLDIRFSLRMYAIDRAAYPPSLSGPVQVGGDESGALCEGGFVGRNSATCAKKTYSRTLPSGLQTQVKDTYTYTPLADNGSDPCTSSAACPHFAIQFMFETDMLYPKGVHVLTDQGVR